MKSPQNHVTPVTGSLNAHLSIALKYKLAAINQYFLHARMLKHAGQLKLADFKYKASIDAMKYADQLVEHILENGGKPDLEDMAKLNIGEDALAMLASDLALNQATCAQLQEALGAPLPEASAALLKRILDNQFEHAAQLRIYSNLQPADKRLANG